MSLNLDELKLVLTDDGSYTLTHPSLPETYHSRFGAVTEATAVFLENSTVKQRLQQGRETAVLEIGFGSGLNSMLTAACANHYQSKLTYIAYEKQLPPVSIIVELLSKNLRDCEFGINNLQHAMANPPITNIAINSHCNLTIINEDVRNSVIPPNTFDAIYLDAFSVSQNPNLWQAEFLTTLHRSLRPGCTLATYSVNRVFKDALSAAGFSWQKRPGPAGKREVIVATA